MNQAFSSRMPPRGTPPQSRKKGTSTAATVWNQKQKRIA